MVTRRLLAAAVSVTAAVVVTAASAGGSAAEPGATVYRLRPDPRMCPSPSCGGFWAARVNSRVTTCLDGTTMPSCYVASVDLSRLTPEARARARAGLAADRALVEATFARSSIRVSPPLAELVGRRVWLAASGPTVAGTVYRVVDTGIRCIRAPCFSLRATAVNGGRSLLLSGLDLSGAKASPRATDRARATLTTGLLVAGTFRVVTKPGRDGLARTLAARQFWLPA